MFRQARLKDVTGTDYSDERIGAATVMPQIPIPRQVAPEMRQPVRAPVFGVMPVRGVQMDLTRLGFYAMADGNFGDKTRRAMAKYLDARHIQAQSIVSAGTDLRVAPSSILVTLASEAESLRARIAGQTVTASSDPKKQLLALANAVETGARRLEDTQRRVAALTPAQRAIIFGQYKAWLAKHFEMQQLLGQKLRSVPVILAAVSGATGISEEDILGALSGARPSGLEALQPVIIAILAISACVAIVAIAGAVVITFTAPEIAEVYRYINETVRLWLALSAAERGVSPEDIRRIQEGARDQPKPWYYDWRIWAGITGAVGAVGLAVYAISTAGKKKTVITEGYED